jgi:hypothetical protein
MPCINFPIDPAIGPVVDIGIAQPTSLAIQGSPPPAIRWLKAIADTGCTTTSIHTDVAKALSLPVISQAAVQSTTQTVVVNVYLVDLFIRVPFGPTAFEWPFKDRPVMELLHASATHDALLGMDMLGMGMFNVNGLIRAATFCW